MSDSIFVALFLVGLLSGGHCAGMCGGIVGALVLQQPGKLQHSQPRSQPGWLLHLGYNGGRILSYALAGTLAGSLGHLGTALLPLQQALYFAASLMLLAMGLYLLGLTPVLAPVERVGQSLWRRVQPLTRRHLPVRSLAQALPLGLLWGWLPCGLVYSALVSAMASGSALRGAGVMLAFGLGTLPNLLLAGYAVVRFRQLVQARAVRVASGLLVLGFGLLGLWRAATFAAG